MDRILDFMVILHGPKARWRCMKVDEWLAETDKDGDGVLSYPEFKMSLAGIDNVCFNFVSLPKFVLQFRI